MASSGTRRGAADDGWQPVTVALAPDADQHVHVQLRYVPDDAARRHDRHEAASDNAGSAASQADAQMQTVGGTNRALSRDITRDGGEPTSSYSP